tara:strand:- start:1168 stop:1485 length:318 start_codon:yes stop_codon:yes gene_type:complete
MFSKILNKIKSILSKKSITEKPKAKKVTKVTKKTKTTKSSKPKKPESKKIIESFKSLPGVGAKSAKALYEAGFKTTKQIISAKDEDLLAVPGVGINLVKKLRDQK